MPTQADIALKAMGSKAAPQAGSQADAALAALQQQAAPQPPNGQSGFMDALTHHFGNLPLGAAQLLANGTAALTHKLQPGTDLDKDTAAFAARANAEMQRREQEYQARSPNSASAYAGAASGELAPFLLGGPTRALDAVGDLATSATRRVIGGSKLLSNVARGSAQGATVSTVSPVSQDGDYWGHKDKQIRTGAVVGAAIPPAISAAVGVGKQVVGAVAPFINPQALVAKALEKLAPNMSLDAIIDALRNPTNLVPGSKPTTAQVLQTPEAVMAEKAVANTPQGKIAMTERQNANNAARLDLIRQHAGTEDDLTRAVMQRRQNADPMTAAVNSGAAIDASPVLAHLDSIASSGLGTDPVIRSAVADARRVVLDQGVSNENGSVFVKPDILDGIRQNVRGYLTKNASNGAVSSRQEAALDPLKNTIVDTINAGVPGYRDYLAAYRADSVPVNTMERLQNLGSHLDTGALDANGNPIFSLTNARKAVKDIDRAQYPIAPEADAAVDNVLSDLQRESVSNSIRSPGSDTKLNIEAPSWLARQLYGDAFSGKPGLATKGAGAGVGAGIGYLAGSMFGPTAAGWAAGTGSGLGVAAASKLANAGSDRINQALIDALMNPDVASEVLQKQSAQAPVNKALVDFLNRAPVIGPYVSQPPVN